VKQAVATNRREMKPSRKFVVKKRSAQKLTKKKKSKLDPLVVQQPRATKADQLAPVDISTIHRKLGLTQRKPALLSIFMKVHQRTLRNWE
jgi:DNA-binding transcriptional regulator YiaG